MASKKRVPIGTVRPVVVEGGGGFITPGGNPAKPSRVVAPPQAGRVWIGSDDPIIDVTAKLTGPAQCTPPRPRYQTDERHGRTSATRYAGQEPLEQTIPIKFDGFSSGSSVEANIRELERLAEPASDGEPPIVKTMGPSIRHQTLKWRVTRIAEDTDRAIFSGDEQVRYYATVTLTQHVRDQVLVLDGKRSQGLRNRTTTVRRGEDSFYDVAKRVYDNRGRAKDIARANPGMRLGQKLKAGDDLRLP